MSLPTSPKSILNDPKYIALRLFGGIIGQPAIPIEAVVKSMKRGKKAGPVEFKLQGRGNGHVVLFDRKTQKPAILSVVGPYLWGSPCDTGNFVPKDDTSSNMPASIRKGVADFDVAYGFALSTEDPHLQMALEHLERELSSRTTFNTDAPRPRNAFQDPSLPMDYVSFSAQVFRRSWAGETFKLTFEPHTWLRAAETTAWKINPTRPRFSVISPNCLMTPLLSTGVSSFRRGDVIYATFTIAYRVLKTGWRSELVPVEVIKIGELSEDCPLRSRADVMDFLVDRTCITEATAVTLAPKRSATDSPLSDDEKGGLGPSSGSLVDIAPRKRHKQDDENPRGSRDILNKEENPFRSASSSDPFKILGSVSIEQSDLDGASDTAVSWPSSPTPEAGSVQRRHQVSTAEDALLVTGHPVQPGANADVTARGHPTGPAIRVWKPEDASLVTGRPVPPGAKADVTVPSDNGHTSNQAAELPSQLRPLLVKPCDLLAPETPDNMEEGQVNSIPATAKKTVAISPRPVISQQRKLRGRR